MTNEIKEILLKDFNEILVKEFCTDWKEKRLYIELLVNSTPFSNLLDCITNLQTIEQQYSAILSENAELENKITNLQEENKEWSMIFDTFSKRPYAHKYLEEKKKELGNNKIIGLDSEMIYKDYYDYKSRNEKAIDLLEPLIDLNGTMTAKGMNKLLNILQGEDKDEKTTL